MGHKVVGKLDWKRCDFDVDEVLRELHKNGY